MKRRTFLSVLSISALSVFGLNTWLMESTESDNNELDKPKPMGGMFAHTLDEDFYVKNKSVF